MFPVTNGNFQSVAGNLFKYLQSELSLYCAMDSSMWRTCYIITHALPEA